MPPIPDILINPLACGLMNPLDYANRVDWSEFVTRWQTT